MSKDNTQRFKLNIIDVFIIALIVFTILTVFLRIFVFSKYEAQGDLREYVISFKAEDVRGTSLKYFIEGDVARIKSKNKVIGRLTGEITHVLSVGEYTENGEMFNSDIEDDPNKITRHDVRGNIIAKGEMTDRGLVLDSGVCIAPNNEFVIITEHIEIGIRIMSVELK